jgi:phosphoglycolate phosphatase-like HAD superfamily hydrolase
VIEPPDQIKRLAARHMTEDLFGRGGKAISIDEILRLRDRIEAVLRSKSASAGFDHECRFSELAEGMATCIIELRRESLPQGSDIPGLSSTIVAAELAAETRALRPKTGMAELLAEIKAADKRIIAISDMYLDGTLIQALLDRLGLGQYIDALYVSSDHALGKYSGRLFQFVFEREAVAPRNILHIGDNPRADFSVPAAAGSSAILFRHPDQSHRQQVNQTYQWLAKGNRYWRGRHLFAGVPAANASDFFRRYGFETLGPIYATYVASLREAMIAQGIEHAFFLARDGELFHQLHHLLDAPALGLPPGPTTTYLHISRKAVALPAVHSGLGARRLKLLLPRMRQRGLAAIADALGIESEALIDLSQRMQLESVDVPIDTGSCDWPGVLAADAELQDMVRLRGCNARALLRRYLEQWAFFGAGRRIALVDIGWNGSIQCGLKDAFGDDDDWPEVQGYYMSFNDNLGHGLEAHEVSGILFDKFRDHPRHNVFEHFEELFENGARALDATTIGYQEQDDGTVAPLLLPDDASDRRAERAFDPIAARLREGALSFMAHFAERYALFGYPSSDLQPFVLELARRAVFHPTREEVDQLFRIIHAEDAGTSSILDFSTYRLSGPWLLLRPRRLLRLLQQSNWKYGSAQSLGVPGFNHLLRLAHRITIARHWSPKRAIHERQIASPHWWEKILLIVVERGGMPILLSLRQMARRGR